MFTLKDFVKRGLLDAVGKLAEYQVILNAAGWLEKGVLTEADLAEIQTAIDALHPVETVTKEETEPPGMPEEETEQPETEEPEEAVEP